LGSVGGVPFTFRYVAAGGVGITEGGAGGGGNCRGGIHVLDGGHCGGDTHAFFGAW